MLETQGFNASRWEQLPTPMSRSGLQLGGGMAVKFLKLSNIQGNILAGF